MAKSLLAALAAYLTETTAPFAQRQATIAAVARHVTRNA
jgi:hypothetical protein